jgi:thiamine-phosphate pyrophosphorylase
VKQHPIEAARLAGIYLVTPDAQRCFDAVLDIVKTSLEAGVRAVQYRDKTVDEAKRSARASELAALTRAAGALFIVNDNIDVAISAGAHGVHLGRDDGDIAEARRRLPHQLIGVSCYDKLEYARLPIAAGADAIAFGSMYASRTKPAAVRAPLSLLTAARAAWPRQRIIAIGGINVDNVADIAAAGAHAAAVIDAIFGAENPAQAARDLVRRFDEGQRRSHT